MIHLRGPMSALRLVSATGLPAVLTRPWEIIDQDGPLAPTRALHQGRGVWIAPGSGEQPGSGAVSWPGTGLAAVPVFSGDRGIGALTVVMGGQGEPTVEQWGFLQAVIAWTEERMQQAPPPARPPREELSGDRLRQALEEVRVGSWDWNIETGELVWDEAALELYGTRPTEFTGRIENWMRIVHPDDLAPTLGAAQKALRDRTVFEAEYRVRRLDGTYGWTQARARATYNAQGEPVRMIGVGWESNESRSARDGDRRRHGRTRPAAAGRARGSR